MDSVAGILVMAGTRCSVWKSTGWSEVLVDLSMVYNRYKCWSEESAIGIATVFHLRYHLYGMSELQMVLAGDAQHSHFVDLVPSGKDPNSCMVDIAVKNFGSNRWTPC